MLKDLHWLKAPGLRGNGITVLVVEAILGGYRYHVMVLAPMFKAIGADAVPDATVVPFTVTVAVFTVVVGVTVIVDTVFATLSV